MKKTIKVPKDVRDAARLRPVLSIDEALAAIGPEERDIVSMCAGDYSKIDPSKLAEAKAEVNKSIVSASMSELSGKLQKLLFLREHYDIDSNLSFPSWLMELSLKLADDLIPGFSPPLNPPGRPLARTPISELKFLYEIERIKLERACNDGTAIKAFLTQSGNTRPSQSEIKTNRNRLSRARNPRHSPLVRLVANAKGKSRVDSLADVIRIFEK